MAKIGRDHFLRGPEITASLTTGQRSTSMRSAAKEILIWTAVGGGALFVARAVARLSRSIQLQGRTVLITGGSRGLGLVLAREFAREGAHIAICARDPDELGRAEGDLREHGARVVAVPCDVTVREDVEQAVQAVQDVFGPIDILVNNAGVIQVGPFEEMGVDDFENAMRTHFWGPLYATLAVLPSMRERKMGRIVNISSLGGRISVPHLLPYGASKFALAGLSQGLRAELSKDGILVTTVLPGLMRTGSPINAFFKGHHRAEYAMFSISDSIPLLSVSAELAAQQIITACRHGDAELVISWPAKIASAFHGFFPGLAVDILGLANRLLPGPGGVGTTNTRGADSTSALSPSLLTRLSDRAALANNEVPVANPG
jgi:NAD(P)-dependent dehydrogenase (short-subunit alcohol dehydrogenase family)